MEDLQLSTLASRFKRKGQKLKTLKRVRHEKGLSQGDLARATGLTRQVISNLERGTSHGHGDTWRRLADGLGVTVDELLEDFYSPKDSSLLTPERALKMPRERLAREIKDSTADQLHKLLGALVGDDLTRSRADLKAGVEGISPDAFSVAIEVRAALIGRGEKPPEEKLPVFKRRLVALHLA